MSDKGAPIPDQVCDEVETSPVSRTCNVSLRLVLIKNTGEDKSPTLLHYKGIHPTSKVDLNIL